jgi:(1->4)-alpha-D-glucan 1-alpha-D-glucosylmutase
VLGDHYGRELEARRIRLDVGSGASRLIVIRYADRSFPVRPETEGAILAEVARRLDDDVLGVAARLLASAERATADRSARAADLAVAERTARHRLEQPGAVDALAGELAAISHDADRLDLVLAHQHHRLARWTVADAELGYRRFFDVDALAATRMDGSVAFDLVHGLAAELLADPVVDGLRVDHVDGLADPGAYLVALRDLAGPEAWLLVEKILRGDEELPAWPVAGTTGYEVADLLGAWSTDPAGAKALLAAWVERAGETRPYEAVALEARREVLAAGFATDLSRVVDSLQEVCRHRRRHRDHARAALHAAVFQLALHTPPYRTYVVPSVVPQQPASATDADRQVIATSLAAARASAPEIDPELLDLVAGVLTGDLRGEPEAQVVIRFQQLTGPVTAKGEEDTALYRWVPLPHRCEVGADPSHPTASADEWHAAALDAQARWPERLTTLSTHDTKRSADARARLAALTATPAELVAAFDRWWEVVGPAGPTVDAGTGWLVFHALVAAWPLDVDRAWGAVEKSVREAGLRTSWTSPDAAFEGDLRRLVETALADAGPICTIDGLVSAAEVAGAEVALAQLLVQLLAPGVPDLYQGAEGWDRSLVDPDNRRPPDPGHRSRLLTDAGTVLAADAWADPAVRRSGLPRTIVLRAALAARRRHPSAVGPGTAGAYRPLMATGPAAERVLAFARGEPAELAVVVARPGSSALASLGAEVELPEGEWTNSFTGALVAGRARIDELLRVFPVALLER